MSFYSNLIADATKAAANSGATSKISFANKNAKIEKQRIKRGSNRTWSEGQQEAQQNALNSLKHSNIFEWIGENWQAAIIAIICILILTR